MKTWDDVQTLVPYVVIGLILSVFFGGKCNLLSLEDKTARSLGVNVNAMRIVISLILLADTLGRTIAYPYEISASIIMSVAGGPFFIILLRRSKKYAD